ncbi:unnamed protein product, partial [Mesorhabditis belari]|uniref:Uncharacterized protein n=1 Tax=Mesorhabditis belari TaxID=2138241 RepID=A0AAF3FE35_9BILA
MFESSGGGAGRRRPTRWITSITLIVTILSSTLAWNPGDLSLPFGLDSSLVKPRFSTYAGQKARDIHVYVMKNISENTPVGYVLDTFKAHDKDLPGFNYTFRINRESDPKRQFMIDQDGTLKVANQLDREDIAVYRLIVEAFDTAGNVGSQMVMVYLQDVNDNGPVPYTNPDPCIFMENTPPEAQPDCMIYARDADTAEYGPPFRFEVNTGKFKYQRYLNIDFDPLGDGGNGSMIVRPTVQFDREADEPGKILEIPLIITDKAGKTNEQSVFIIIGDENDNPMHDGRMTITVNSYLGKLQKSAIGRVYVDDKDDWDLPDKRFSWKKSVPGFDLSTMGGEITMDGEMPSGTYTLIAEVVDTVRNERAEGRVDVTVTKVEQVEFDSQGAIQLLLSHETAIQLPSDFIRMSDGTSPLETFRSEVASYIGGGAGVHIFSIQLDHATLQTGPPVPVVTVRFAVSSAGQYRDPAMLQGLLASHRTRLQQKLGTIVVSVGVDMCKFTTCDNGCRTENTATFEGVRVDANATVFVGVNAKSTDKCECPVWDSPAQCRHGLCYNGGVCHNTYPGFFCECRNDAVKGLRCQGTTRSFGGSGFAWYKAMPACTFLDISLQFMTSSNDGILLYNGPMSDSSDQYEIEYRDYIIIALRGGQVVLEMNMNGQVSSNVTVASGTLSDGKWHDIHVRQEGRYIELVVDGCRYLTGGANGQVDDRSCRATLVTRDDDERLNIVTPLQIGGLAPLTNQNYPPIIASQPALTGCIRNLIVNNDQYDLETPAYEQNTERGCKLWGSACDANTIDTISHCVHGDCYADVGGAPKCICDPGWGGDRCERKLEWVQFSANAYLEYSVLNEVLDEQWTDVDLLFVPGRSASVSELSYGSDGMNYVSTSVENQAPTAKMLIQNNGAANNPQPTSLQLEGVQLKDNVSYWLQFARNPTRAQLTLDGSYIDTQPLDPTKQSFALPIKELLLSSKGGGSVRGFQGCVGTYRWNKLQLPLSKSDDASSNTLIHLATDTGVTQGCSLRITCQMLGASYCQSPFVCMDFWKGPFCTCPEGAHAQLDINDGQVTGCGGKEAYARLGISSPAIILILVSLLLLIVLVLLMVVYSRRQTPPFEAVRPEDLNRDNLRPYAIEGGGENDTDQYNIANLRKPVMGLENGGGLGLGHPIAPPSYPDRPPPVDDALRSRLRELESDPNSAPFDELRVYEDEGDNVSMVTLESLESQPGGGSANPANDHSGGGWGSRYDRMNP